MNDLPALIASAGGMTGVAGAFAMLLRANLLKDKLLAEVMKEQGEATRAAARADYAVALALQRLEQKMGLPPSSAIDPQPTAPPPTPTTPPTGGQV